MKNVYKIKDGQLAGGFTCDDSYQLKSDETTITPSGINTVWNGTGWVAPNEDTSDLSAKKITDEILSLQKSVGKLMLDSIKKGVN